MDFCPPKGPLKNQYARHVGGFQWTRFPPGQSVARRGGFAENVIYPYVFWDGEGVHSFHPYSVKERNYFGSLSELSLNALDLDVYDTDFGRVAAINNIKTRQETLQTVSHA